MTPTPHRAAPAGCQPAFALTVLLCAASTFADPGSMGSLYADQPASAGQARQADNRIPPGFMLIEGDVVVPEDFYETRATHVTNLWPSGIVYFELDANVNSTNRARLIDAMNEWAARADLTFVPRTTESAYIHVFSGSGNWSFVGRTGGRQDLSIYNWTYKYIIAHELGHALGFWHEQSRPDRDTFVTIEWGNIEPGREGNFARQTSAGTVGPYDFDSIMHYGSTAFTCCCLSHCRTITVLPPNEDQQLQIGQRSHLSEWDGRGMAALYGFDDPDCNDNTIRDVIDISSGTSEDCNANLIPDECDTSGDANNNGILDDCEPPFPIVASNPYNIPKNRYLTFGPNNGLNERAFELLLPDGRIGWVGAPKLEDWSGTDQAAVSVVVENPVFRLWDETEIHVTGCAVVPGEEYQLRATEDGTSFGQPLLLATTPSPSVGAWADVVGFYDTWTFSWTAPDGFVNFNDINAVIKKFQLSITAPHVTVVDLHPQWPNYFINFSDIDMVIKGFQGATYPVPVTDCQGVGNCPLTEEAPCLP